MVLLFAPRRQDSVLGHMAFGQIWGLRGPALIPNLYPATKHLCVWPGKLPEEGTLPGCGMNDC